MWQFPYESGNFGEVESIDALGKREYSWLHPREYFSQEGEFYLGNPGFNMFAFNESHSGLGSALDP